MTLLETLETVTLRSSFLLEEEAILEQLDKSKPSNADPRSCSSPTNMGRSRLYFMNSTAPSDQVRRKLPKVRYLALVIKDWKASFKLFKPVLSKFWA